VKLLATVNCKRKSAVAETLYQIGPNGKSARQRSIITLYVQHVILNGRGWIRLMKTGYAIEKYHTWDKRMISCWFATGIIKHQTTAKEPPALIVRHNTVNKKYDIGKLIDAEKNVSTPRALTFVKADLVK